MGVVVDAGGCWPSDLGGRFGPGDFVSDSHYRRLDIEIDAVAGRNAGPNVYSRLRAGLDRLSDEGALRKPEGVRFDVDEEVVELGDDDAVHSIEELAAAHDAVIDLGFEADAAALHVFWVDGHYEGDIDGSPVLGFSYRGDRIIMLRDNIERVCDGGRPLGLESRRCERTMSTVLLHEMGHAFGLVNNGAPLQSPHQDEAHGAHCDNENCLMFFGVETASAADLVEERLGGGGGDDIFFDDHCLDDLRALAGP